MTKAKAPGKPREMMVKNYKLFALLLTLALLSATALFARSASASIAAQASAQATPAPQTPTTPPQAASESSARGLTPQEKRGKAIYLRGESASGREIVAMVGEVDVPASTVTCAGCHGTRAEGKTEGGVTAGNLTWSNLIKPYGHTHPTGRKHGPFNETSLIRAITGGVDPDGNELAVAMPRYRMSVEDMADLIAYLRRIEADRDPGLSEDRITVGTILPAAGPLAEMGAAMRDVLTAYFDDVNSRGGIYNRKVELRVANSGSDAATTAASVNRFIETEQPFALVGGMSAGADRELSDIASASEVPFIGPSTLLPQSRTPVNRHVFYLLPGLTEQARALANFAARRAGQQKPRVAIMFAESEVASAAAAALEEQVKKLGLTLAAHQRYKPGAFNAGTVQAFKEAGVGVVFFFGTGGDDVAFLKEAANSNYAPDIFLAGTLTSSALVSSVPLAFKDKIFLSFPTVPTDITPEGMAEFRALHEKYKFAPRHTAAQLSAFAAAKIFVEGLKRSGRDLSREKLITALEGLYDFDTGVMPHITFGPNRRVGAAGANVVTINPEKREFVALGEWVRAY